MEKRSTLRGRPVGQADLYAPYHAASECEVQVIQQSCLAS
jgi:hypothetical protein